MGDLEVKKRVEALPACPELMDDPEMAVALEETDPDPHAHAPQFLTFDEKSRAFSSVTTILPQKTAGALFKDGSSMRECLDSFADQYAASLTSMSAEEILKLAADLEAKAFRFDPATGKMPVADEGAMLELRNLLNAVERAAYDDDKFLARMDRKEIYRLSILASPDMTEETRGGLHRLEAGMGTLQEWMEEERKAEVDFLQNYDGAQPSVEHPYFKRAKLEGEFLLLTRPREELLRANEENARKYQKANEAIYLKRGVPLKELRAIPKMSDEVLLGHIQSANVSTFGPIPRERVRGALTLMACITELALRKKDRSWVTPALVEKLVGPFSKLNQRLGHLPNPKLLNRAFETAIEGSSTASRIDNYRARDDFLQLIGLTLFTAMNDENSLLRQMGGDLSLDSFLGTCIAFAENARIPFVVEDLLTGVDAVREASGISHGLLTNGNGKKVTWEEIQKAGRVTVALEDYPQNENDWENEIAWLKKITYGGIPVYDLARQAVRSVTLVPNIPGEKGDHSFLGTARTLLRDVRLAYADEKGKLIPVYERLRVLAHETFHNAEGLLQLRGVPQGGGLPVLAERDAYLFSAYVVEQYLRERLARDKAFSGEEFKAIVDIIANDRLVGGSADWMVSHFFQGSLDSDAIELPPATELKITEAYNKEVAKDKSVAVLGNSSYLGDQAPGNFLMALGFMTRFGRLPRSADSADLAKQMVDLGWKMMREEVMTDLEDAD